MPVTSRKIIDNGVILIDGHRISALAAHRDIDIPAGYERIELDGKTVIPGLFDAHAHGPMSNQQLTPQQNWTSWPISPLG